MTVRPRLLPLEHRLTPASVLYEAFDTVTAPALPAGWTAEKAAADPYDWQTRAVSVNADNYARALTAPNYVSLPYGGVDERLVSPVVTVPNTPGEQLRFEHVYYFNSSGAFGAPTYQNNGGVLEVNINGGGWQDILAAGGSFAAGGYTTSVASNSGTVLAGRPAWADVYYRGSSRPLAFQPVAVNLPAAALGQPVQFRWRAAGGGYTWDIDSVRVGLPPAAVQITAGNPQTVGQNQAPQPLRVRVVDAAGDPVVGQRVTFTVVDAVTQAQFYFPTPQTSVDPYAHTPQPFYADPGKVVVATDADGFVTVYAQASYTLGTFHVTATVDGLTPATFAVTVSDSQTLPGAVSGYVLLYGAGTPIAGVTVKLLAPDGPALTVAATTTTDAAGKYRFADLAPGQYWIQEVQPAGYLDGPEYVGSTGGALQVNDVLSAVPVPSGGESVGNNFFENSPPVPPPPPPPPPPPAAVSGFVYVDSNDDGVYGFNQQPVREQGVRGVTVLLRAPDGHGGTSVVATATTDGDGQYRFGGLAAGQYWIQEVQPAGYADGKETLGTTRGALQVNDIISGVPVAVGQESSWNNFGELPTPPLPGALSGFVYVDANDNGVFDAGEQPVRRATVYLRAPDGGGGTTAVAVATTDGDGQYRFANLTPGQYWVQEVQPDGYADGKESLGSTGGALQVNDVLSAVPVYAGGESSRNNFGEVLPGALSGFVYVDGNSNGLFDAGEQPVRRATVYLRVPDGAAGTYVVATATTDGDGQYRFGGLAAGQYWVQEFQPAGYADGRDTLGTTGGVLQVNDIISAVPVYAGAESSRNNFGELPG